MSAAAIAPVEDKMKKALESLQRDFAQVRTNRATVNMLDNVRVEAYGQLTPLSGVATVNVQDVRTLMVTAWDAGNIKKIDAAIREFDNHMNPRIDGVKLFISLPELTTERRNELVKTVKKKSEDSKVIIRNIRRDANEELKEKEKKKEISQDELKTILEQVQKLTDATIEKVDQATNNKTKELTTL